jgi:hypothetical protein
LRAGRTEAVLTKDNHVEWAIELNAGEQRELCVKWAMEFPLNESVVYSNTIGGVTTAPHWSNNIAASSNNYCQLMGSQQRVY